MKQKIVVNKAEFIKCELCGQKFSRWGIVGHIKYTENYDIEKYVHEFGEFRLSKLGEGIPLKHDIIQVECKICKKQFPIVGMATHLKYTEKLTVTEYISLHGEYRPKYLDYEKRALINQLECKFPGCGRHFGSERLLTYHIRLDHNTDKLEYIEKYVFNNEKQYCKCGCNQEVRIRLQPPYKRDYLSGHNPDGMIGRRHTSESKSQMSIAAKDRIQQDIENNIKSPWHTQEAIKKRCESYSNSCYSKKLSKYNITFLNDRLDQSLRGVYKWKCNVCNAAHTQYHSSYFICKQCYPFIRSKQQKDVLEYIQSIYNGTIVENYRKFSKGKHEIDIFLPELNIGIEYNGLYWHSDVVIPNKKYHLEKLEICEANNIHLIQIFEDEWLQKQDIIKHRLSNLLINTQPIYAKNCTIKEINSTDKKEFLIKYHLQGDDKSKIKLGAYHDNKLVAVMTFGKFRISLGTKHVHDNEYELMRFATSQHVIGIAGKLLSFFKLNYNPIKIISYADRKWTSSKLPSVYDIIGFNWVGFTPPNYWYFEPGRPIRHHRFIFRKSELVRMGHDKNKTETQIMHELGYARIWDCGNIKYELKIN